MTTHRKLIGLGAGTLLLAGVIAANPFAGASSQDANPADDDRAAAIALEAYPGTTVVAIEAEEEGGRLLHEVELSNGVEVEIDLATGKIVDSEEGDDD